LGAAVLALIGAVSATTQGLPVAFDWSTVANNGTTPPGSDRLFNSCNQPSVNERGMVAFRARSKGGQGLGEPLRASTGATWSGARRGLRRRCSTP
jgi:hypothetical protein